MNILIYSRKGIYDWATSFKNFLINEGVNAEIITELTFEGDIKLSCIYNNHENLTFKNSCAFNEDQINDIIIRCRLLRSLEFEKSKKMIIIYTNILEKIFDDKKITHFISVRVDNYILDIIYRLSVIKSFKFVGLWKSAIINNKIFITARGEFNYLNNSDNELLHKFNTTLNSDKFKATSLKVNNKPTVISSLGIFLISYVRAIVLFALRHIHKDYYGYRYLATPLFVNDYKLNFINIFSHLLFTKDWNNSLINLNIGKKLFIGLQVNPEATIDYYVNDIELIHVENVINKIIKNSTAEGITIFIKDHPNMLGKRSFQFLRRIKNYKNVYLIPSYVDSNYIINHVDAVFTWSGTIGIQAAIRGKCSIIVDAPYYSNSFYYKIRAFKDLDDICMFISNHKPRTLSKDEIDCIAKNVTDSLIDGNLNFKEKSLVKLNTTFLNIFKNCDV